MISGKIEVRLNSPTIKSENLMTIFCLCWVKCAWLLSVCVEYFFKNFKVRSDSRHFNFLRIYYFRHFKNLQYHTPFSKGSLRIFKEKVYFSPFYFSVSFLYLLKTSKEVWLFDVFTEYSNGTLGLNLIQRYGIFLNSFCNCLTFRVIYFASFCFAIFLFFSSLFSSHKITSWELKTK